MPPRRIAAIWLLLVPVAAGCPDRPRAPSLDNEPVFRNDSIGLRFLAPDGWAIASRAELPPGRLPKPIILVSYIQNTGEKPAEFELMAADIRDGTDLGAYLTEHKIGSEKWNQKATPQEVSVNGTTGTRYLMSRVVGKAEYRREATAFRRGERVYFFVVTFGLSDGDRRDQARKSVESATWTK